MHSNVSSDWLPRYTEATRSVIEILKIGWILSGQPSYTEVKLQAFYNFALNEGSRQLHLEAVYILDEHQVPFLRTSRT
jgi:hypothetical protein